jgi:hypothetical protein
MLPTMKRARLWWMWPLTRRLLRNVPADHPQESDFRGGRRVHYCVANMPGAVPKTSTLALTNATLP